MRTNILMKAVAGAGLLFCGLTANAQYQPQYDRYEQRRYDIQEQMRLFERIRADLNRAGSNFRLDRDDRFRIDIAHQQLNDMQNMVVSGNFDERELQQAIRSLRRVVNQNPMPQRVRDNLEVDLERLRELRWR
jgi:ribosome-binding ATPase YchF (GTP1/OBG family)